MGKVLSIVLRQSRRVFAQERAERIISKPKPTMHPYYPTEEKILKQIKAEHPELIEKVREHYPKLDERVSSLKITSSEIKITPSKQLTSGVVEKKEKLLPQDRLMHPETEFGFYEPHEDKVPKGRILFSHAANLLMLYETEPEQARRFARGYGIDENKTKLLFEYFVPFTKSVDLIEEKKEEIDMTKKEFVGHRALLQKNRLVSELEQQRISAKIIDKQKSDQPDQLESASESDRKTKQ